MFSKTSEYGIRATIYIAGKSQKGERTSLKEISTEINSPKAFTAKILQLLVKSNIVESIKGTSGGFEIPQHNLKNIKISDILKAVGGVEVYNLCGMGLRDCSPKTPCPIHHKYKLIREEINAMLQNSDLEELAQNLNDGIVFLKL